MAEDTFELDVNDFKEESEQAETQETAPKESSTEDTKAPEVADESDKDTITPEKETEEADQEDTADPDADASDETNDSDKPQAKNSAQNRIRTLANENRELKRQIEQVTAQVYKPATADELVEQGMSETDARVEALTQQMQIEKYNNHVAALTADLNVESQQVLHDFPIFDKDNKKEYDPDFAEMVHEMYFKTAKIEKDPKTGMFINADVLPYDFYKSFVTARKSGHTKGEVNGKKNATKELAAAEIPSGVSPKKESKDAFLEGFDSIK
jgi:hypothetical protein